MMKKMKIFKRFAVVVMSVMLLIACGCDENPAGNNPTEAPSTEIATPEPQKSMQDVLDSLADIEFTKAKNVILFIGDGMGENHINATKEILNSGYNGKMAIEYLPNQGSSITVCMEGEPDSASGGTALATGYKSKRKYLGLDSNQNEVQNVVELALSLGKKAGVVTNESIVDATPGTFTVHAPNRDDETNIAKLQIENCPDIIMGGGKAVYEQALAADPSYVEKMKSNGITWATDWEQVKSFKEGKLIATLTDDLFDRVEEATPTLAEMTEKALELLSNDEDGFFLMVEGGAMDESAHGGDVMETCRQMVSFDEAVCCGIRYAAEHPDTIVIVTADHDTGGLSTIDYANAHITAAGNKDYHINELLKYEEALQQKYPDVILADLPYRFTTIAHTNNNVQIFAIGYGTEIFNEARVPSYKIGKFIGEALGAENFGQ